MDLCSYRFFPQKGGKLSDFHITKKNHVPLKYAHFTGISVCFELNRYYWKNLRNKEKERDNLLNNFCNKGKRIWQFILGLSNCNSELKQRVHIVPERLGSWHPFLASDC